jgi:membrane associated rhomboid family serine protease
MKVLKRIQYNSPVILTYSLAALVFLIINELTGDAANVYFFSVYRTSPADPMQYARLFLHVFGHASLDHYFGNIILLLLIGPMLEEKYGSKWLALMMGVTALISGLVFILISSKALLGGSGLVFMFILLSSFTNIRGGKIPLTLVFVFLVFIGREVISGATVDDNISNLTHVIGGICGVVFGFIFHREAFAEEKE